MHPDYAQNSNDWEQIQTCLLGERAVKAAREKYLPYPVTNVDRDTPDFTNMYEIYLSGSHFVNFTEESKSDLVNSAFREPPKVTPEDTTNTVVPAAKKTVSQVVSFGRVFLLTDYPSEFPADITPHPYILVYSPLDVLDWSTNEYSGDQTLVYVLLREQKQRIPGDAERQYQYRELILEDNVYKVRIKDTPEATEYTEYIPTAADSSNFNYIPGTFCGSVDNDPNIDQSPILGISNSNIKHYQTFAELTSTTVYLGSPTLALTGLPAGWIKAQAKNDNKIKVGADLALAIEGDSAKAALLEINSDLTHYKTLDKLESSMAEQGFMLRSAMSRGGAETATTVQLRQASQMSKLGMLINNAEEALNLVLTYAVDFGAIPMKIELNKDFFPKDVCSLEATNTQTQLLTQANNPDTVSDKLGNPKDSVG